MWDTQRDQTLQCEIHRGIKLSGVTKERSNSPVWPAQKKKTLQCDTQRLIELSAMTRKSDQTLWSDLQWGIKLCNMTCTDWLNFPVCPTQRKKTRQCNLQRGIKLCSVRYTEVSNSPVWPKRDQALQRDLHRRIKLCSVTYTEWSNSLLWPESEIKSVVWHAQRNKTLLWDMHRGIKLCTVVINTEESKICSVTYTQGSNSLLWPKREVKLIGVTCTEEPKHSNVISTEGSNSKRNSVTRFFVSGFSSNNCSWVDPIGTSRNDFDYKKNNFGVIRIHNLLPDNEYTGSRLDSLGEAFFQT